MTTITNTPCEEGASARPLLSIVAVPELGALSLLAAGALPFDAKCFPRKYQE